MSSKAVAQDLSATYAANRTTLAALDAVAVPDAVESGSVGKQKHFVPNSYKFWSNPKRATTHLTAGCTGSDCSCTPGTANCTAIPAYGDILVNTSNFVWCKGGPYALCYYSGPSTGSEDLSCTLTADGRYANCNCFEVPWGAYFVDMNSILNYKVYKQTVQVCGADGSLCTGATNVNKAPVCQAINQKKLIPGADLVSTFSLDCVPSDGLGQTNCGQAPYAGCMTAPCKRTGTQGIVQCSCPIYNGPYQVGVTLDDPTSQCTLGGDLVWSAAFSPAGTTIPPLTACIPDAPGGNGCPLFNATMTPPAGTDCKAICDAYSCKGKAKIESAYTCDATLCTGQCNDRNLTTTACSGLSKCPAAGLAAIAQLEAAVGCSCCASQLCGCQPDSTTNAAIFDLNALQRKVGITPQCDVNDTLCGAQAGASMAKLAKQLLQ
jgi:hypothetical protein